MARTHAPGTAAMFDLVSSTMAAGELRGHMDRANILGALSNFDFDRTIATV